MNSGCSPEDDAMNIKDKSAVSKAARLSVAPMMDWTDRYCRGFHRRLSRHALLYTEMVTAPAVIHGPRDRLLHKDAIEHPVARASRCSLDR